MTNKKFLFIGMAVLLSVSLFFLGCPTEAGEAGEPGKQGEQGEQGGSGQEGPIAPGLVKGSVSIEALQHQIDIYDGTASDLTLDGVTLTDDGLIDFKSVNAYIAGTFATFATSGKTTIKARSANITFSGTGGITAQSDDIVIVKDEIVAKVTGVTPLAYEASIPPSPSAILKDTAVETLSLGTGGTSKTDLESFASTFTVYVLGTLSIDATAPVAATAAKLVALGDTEAAGTGGITFGDNTEIGTLKATNALKITSVGTGEVQELALNGQTVTIDAVTNIAGITGGPLGGTIALGSGTGLPATAVGAADVTVTSSGVSLTVDELTTGAGKLVLPATAITFTATAGGGNIAYPPTLAAAANIALSSASGLAYAGNLTTSGTLGVTGDLAVTGTLSAGATTLDGDLDVSGVATLTSLTDSKSGGATVAFNGATAEITGYTAKATADATTFEGSATLTITTLTDISSDATTVTFNGPAIISTAVTTLDSGLTIAGTGAVALTLVPTLTNGLVVSNTGGVTMPSATIPPSKAIDASLGKVVFGTADNAVTIVNGKLESGTGSNLSTVNANGVITVAYSDGVGAKLTLKDEGTLAVKGSGSVTVAGALKIEGDGTTLASAGDSVFTADNAKATLKTSASGATSDGIQIGTAANGVALLVNADNTEMEYTFVASTGTGYPVSVSGADITVPGDSTTGASFTATTADKAKIVLGTTTGGFVIGVGTKGGKFNIIGSSGGSTIGPFPSGHADGNLPTSSNLNTSDQSGTAGKVKLGAWDGTSHDCTVTGSGVTAYGLNTGSAGTINAAQVLAET
jgi:hypothetical protein